ncbi:hypothetical protein ES703_31385 [subsurface metagenome]
MLNKNAMALFITYCIVLIISWFVWGHTTAHIWSAWLLSVLLLIGILIHALMMFDRIQKDNFDSTFLFNILGIVFFDLFMLNGVSNIGITAVSVIGYIISGILAISLVFAIVRYFQHQASG